MFCDRQADEKTDGQRSIIDCNYMHRLRVISVMWRESVNYSNDKAEHIFTGHNSSQKSFNQKHRKYAKGLWLLINPVKLHSNCISNLVVRQIKII